MTIHMNLGNDSYDIVVEKGILSKAGELLNLNRRVLIVTDSGVPSEYSKKLSEQCKSGTIYTVPEGEASAYMRGIDFYNIPTTLLSQIDSSIGGKTAINFGGMKNIVGAFYQPKKVLIDPELLKTLPARQISNGLAEAVKMSLTSDKKLFELFEKEDIESNLEKIIISSLNIKKSVVEQDEKEQGLRKILNFGHTLAHAIESANGMQELYHGECVALGMLPMCSREVRERLMPVLEKLGLPTVFSADYSVLSEAMSHDKKKSGKKITVIFVEEIGSFRMKDIDFNELAQIMKEAVKE